MLEESCNSKKSRQHAAPSDASFSPTPRGKTHAFGKLSLAVPGTTRQVAVTASGSPCAHVAHCACFPPSGVTTPPLEIAAEKKGSQIAVCGAGSHSPSPPSLQGPTPSARLCRCAESGRQNVSSTLPTCSRPVFPDALRYRVIPVQPCSRVSNIKACPAAGPRCASCLRTSITARVSTHTALLAPHCSGLDRTSSTGDHAQSPPRVLLAERGLEACSKSDPLSWDSSKPSHSAATENQALRSSPG